MNKKEINSGYSTDNTVYIHLLNARLVMLSFQKVSQLRLRNCRSQSVVNTVDRKLLHLS